METLHVTGIDWCLHDMLILRVQEFAFANSMMFIETSAKTRPEQIHVQLQIFELVLRVDFESFFGWSRAEAKGGSIAVHAIACCKASSLVYRHKKNTRFMLARRTLVSAMATASWPKTSTYTAESIDVWGQRPSMSARQASITLCWGHRAWLFFHVSRAPHSSAERFCSSRIRSLRS